MQVKAGRPAYCLQALTRRSPIELAASGADLGRHVFRIALQPGFCRSGGSGRGGVLAAAEQLGRGCGLRGRLGARLSRLAGRCAFWPWPASRAAVFGLRGRLGGRISPIASSPWQFAYLWRPRRVTARHRCGEAGKRPRFKSPALELRRRLVPSAGSARKTGTNAGSTDRATKAAAIWRAAVAVCGHFNLQIAGFGGKNFRLPCGRQAGSSKARKRVIICALSGLIEGLGK